MQLTVEQAMQRGGFGEERYEKREFQQKVKSIYEEQLRTSIWEVSRRRASCSAWLETRRLNISAGD
jgi:hypothetical protein